MDGRIDPPEVIGPRLRNLRVALGFASNQKGFAKKCGIESRTWNNYERLKRVPSREEAAKIRHATGITLDYIFHGDTKGMAFDLVTLLREAEGQPKKRA